MDCNRDSCLGSPKDDLLESLAGHCLNAAIARSCVRLQHQGSLRAEGAVQEELQVAEPHCCIAETGAQSEGHRGIQRILPQVTAETHRKRSSTVKILCCTKRLFRFEGLQARQ